MTGGEIAAAAAVFVFAGILLVLGVLQLREKGIPLNNGWIWASRKEREETDVKPLYRQSGVVFCMLSAVFAVTGLSIVLRDDRITLFCIPIFLAAVAYSVISSLRMRRK